MRAIDKQHQDYIDNCKDTRKMTDQSLVGKKSALKLFMRDVRIDDMRDLTTEHLIGWISQQSKRGIAGRTINTRIAHVVAFIKYLRDDGYTLQVNIQKIPKVNELPPRRKFFTRDDIEKAKSLAPLEERLMISLAFDAGLRITELTNLRMSNINGRRITLIGKGNKEGHLFMTPETAAVLQVWIDTRQPMDYIFPSTKLPNKPYHTTQVRRKMSVPFKKAGLEGFYPHSLRHSYGTELQVNGADLMTIQEFMRHSNASITQKYLHGLDTGILETQYHRLMSFKNKDSIEGAVAALLNESIDERDFEHKLDSLLKQRANANKSTGRRNI